MSEYVLPDGLKKVEGILELDRNKSGVLLDPKKNGKSCKTDAFVSREFIQRYNIKRGSYLVTQSSINDRHPNPKVRFIDTIDGLRVDERKRVPGFAQLTTVTPDQMLHLEVPEGPMTTRIIDLFCPIGKGQRGLIVAPPRTGKTTLLQNIASGLRTNHPECHVMVLLVDERPEEVTDFKRNVDAEIFASSNDETLKDHVRISEFAVERAKRLVEVGKDVVLLIDSLTRLSRAYNATKAGSGRTMTGGLDARALEKPRQLFSSARKTEEAGSLTIIASALIETGSRMDDLIFQEFKGTGNMEMVLDRKIAEMRLWPAINIAASGTRKEELLLDAETLEKAHFFRRALSSMRVDEAAETMISRMSRSKSNKEFLKLLNLTS
ncbi:MAG: transcription termination factor Rho [Verrucomicrobia bacterium GWC2_42_7]|nr:MAG: transcription termination factor Rho [Verrucomicrobia bacterium GWC2_42_7]